MNQDGCQVTLNQSEGRIEIGMTIDLTTVSNVKQFFTKESKRVA